MYESRIETPTFEERRWQLRGPRGAVLSVVAIALGFAGYIFWGASVNDKPLEHEGTIYLDVAATNAVIAVIGCVMLLIAVFSAIAAWRMVMEYRWIVLGNTYVEAPMTAVSKRITRIPYSELQLKVHKASSTAVEMCGAGDELIRVATLNFASEEELQECIGELRRRLAEIEEAAVW